MNYKKTIESEVEQGESVCKYFHYCMVKKDGRDCSAPTYKTCKTWELYNKYGEEYNSLGI